MTNIISCSLPDDLAEFIKQNKQVKPSKVLQDGLYRLRDEENKLKARLIKLEHDIVDKENHIYRLWKFINSRDLKKTAQEFIEKDNVLE